MGGEVDCPKLGPKGVVLSANHPHFKYAFSIDCNKANGMKMFFRQNCNYQGWRVC